VVGQQPGGQPPVTGGLGVPDRLHRVAVARQPPCRQLVQRGDLLWLSAAQFQLQQVGEQVMVAEPGPRRVQRHHKRVGLLQVLQHPFPTAGPGQQISQLAVDAIQPARAQQQPPHLAGLPLQHLGQQVFRHGPFGPGELRCEPLRIRMTGQRQRRQPQPRRPAFRPLVQYHHRRVGQFHSGGIEQLSRLGYGEPQIGLANLGQLALQPQPVQPEPHVMPGGQHEPQLWRGPHQPQFQLPPRLVRAQLVQVIDH
jgi:hypothetical protein